MPAKLDHDDPRHGDRAGLLGFRGREDEFAADALKLTVDGDLPGLEVEPVHAHAEDLADAEAGRERHTSVKVLNRDIRCHEIEERRIERPTDPIEQMIVFLVLGVSEHLEQLRVSAGSAAVLGWTTFCPSRHTACFKPSGGRASRGRELAAHRHDTAFYRTSAASDEQRQSCGACGDGIARIDHPLRRHARPTRRNLEQPPVLFKDIC